MNNARNIMILTMTVVVLFCASFTFAAPTAPTDVSVQQSSSRDLDNLGAQTVAAQGGNVTEVNIEALTITTSWQGYYGDISGEITLDDASNNTFYNWSVATVAGEVFATRISSVDWDNVNCSSATNITSEETYLGQTSSDGDSVTNTYTGTTHVAFDAGTSNILANTCNVTFGYENNASQSTNWLQVLLYDFTNDGIIYTTLIDDDSTGFDGGTYDFQLLVGENEKTGNEGVTTYYFWVELE